MSMEYTVEQVRDIFIRQVECVTYYWANNQREMTTKERCEGVAFSIMNIIDGTSCLPAFDLIVSPHPDDKQFNKREGNDWFPEKVIINDCYLHELLFNSVDKNESN